MSFFNIFNELVSQENILEDLINYYKELHDENKTEITDFTEGSEIRTLLEVLSHLGYNLLEETNNTLKNHFISTAEGEYLDMIGANPNVNLPRGQGTTATSLIKFYIASAVNEEILIPAGTTISNADVSYETDVDGVISIGETYTHVNATCTVDGVEGNCNANRITEVVDLNSNYNVQCTNEEPVNNGFDFEEDDEYRQKLLEFVRADNFGSRGYYENLLLNIPNVHDIKRFGDFIEAPAISYYINTNQGSTADEEAVIEAISLLVNEDNIVIGHEAQIFEPVYWDITITVAINNDCGILEDDIIDIVTTYFKGGECTNYPFVFNGFNLGETADSSVIETDIKNLSESITDLTITVSGSRELEDYEVYNITDVQVSYV